MIKDGPISHMNEEMEHDSTGHSASMEKLLQESQLLLGANAHNIFLQKNGTMTKAELYAATKAHIGAERDRIEEAHKRPEVGDGELAEDPFSRSDQDNMVLLAQKGHSSTKHGSDDLLFLNQGQGQGTNATTGQIEQLNFDRDFAAEERTAALKTAVDGMKGCTHGPVCLVDIEAESGGLELTEAEIAEVIAELKQEGIELGTDFNVLENTIKPEAQPLAQQQANYDPQEQAPSTAFSAPTMG